MKAMFEVSPELKDSFVVPEWVGSPILNLKGVGFIDLRTITKEKAQQVIDKGFTVIEVVEAKTKGK